jgi:hypothetical protein
MAEHTFSASTLDPVLEAAAASSKSGAEKAGEFEAFAERNGLGEESPASEGGKELSDKELNANYEAAAREKKQKEADRAERLERMRAAAGAAIGGTADAEPTGGTISGFQQSWEQQQASAAAKDPTKAIERIASTMLSVSTKAIGMRI